MGRYFSHELSNFVEKQLNNVHRKQTLFSREKEIKTRTLFSDKEKQEQFFPAR